jgi:hypothetical protein
MAIQDPIRALPLSRIRASIVTPSAATVGTAAGARLASAIATAANARQDRRA